jgi:hypothetical protein
VDVDGDSGLILTGGIGMARRQRKRSRTRRALDSEFAKPIGALILLGLLYLAFQIGLVAWVVDIPMSILRGDR